MSEEEIWACHACTFENPSNHKRCHVCQARRAVEQEQRQQQRSRTPTSSVLSWIQRRHKRKRSPQPTVRVRIQLNGEEWELLQARISPPRRTLQSNAANPRLRNENDTAVSEENGTRDEETMEGVQGTVSESVGRIDSYQSAAANKHVETSGGSKGAPGTGKSNVHYLKITLSLPETASIEAVQGKGDREFIRMPTDTTMDSQTCVTTEPSPQQQVQAEIMNGNRTANTDQEDKKVSSQASVTFQGQDLAITATKGRESDNGEWDAAMKDGSQVSVEAVACVDAKSTKEVVDACQQEEIDSFAANSTDEVKNGDESTENSMRSDVNVGTNAAPKITAQCDEKALSRTMTDLPKHQNEKIFPAASQSNEICHSIVQPSYQADTLDDVQPSEVCRPPRGMEYLGRDAADTGKQQDSLARCRKAEDKAGVDDNTPSDDNTVDIGFSQLMSQEPSEFLYTQMSQGEAENSFFVPQVDSADTTDHRCSKSKEPADELCESKASENDVLPCIRDKTDSTGELFETRSEEVPNAYRQASSPRQPLKEMNPPSPPEKPRNDSSEPELKKKATMRQDQLKHFTAFSATVEADDCFAQRESMKFQSESNAQSVPMFQTAGRGSVISVSDASLDRAKALPQDSVASNEAMTSPRKSSLRAGEQRFAAVFHTAGNGSKISVTEDILRKSKELFEESLTNAIDVTQHFPARPASATVSVSAAPSSSPNTYLHATEQFQTHVEGKSTSEIADSLSMVERLMKGATAADASDSFKEPPNRLQPIFGTAGKQSAIPISDECISRATSLLHDIADSCTGPAQKQPFRGVASETNCFSPSMFRTACRRRAIRVSAEGLAHADSLLQGKLETAETPKAKLRPKVPSVNADFTQSQARWRATGNETMNSEVVNGQAVQAAHRTKAVSAEPATLSNCSSSAPTFQTVGNGNSISVSDDSLVQATSLFEKAPSFHTSDGSTNERLKPCPSLSSKGASVSFQTAGKGTAISISYDSLKKADRLLNEGRVAGTDVIFTRTRSGDDRSSLSPCPQSGFFRTAGRNAAISVSEGSMVQATALLREKTPREVESGRKSSYRDLTSVCRPEAAFSTASKKKAVVSEHALKQAAALLQDKSLGLTETVYGTQPRPCLTASSEGVSHVVPSFRSAGKGEILSVSEEILTKARVFLQERGETDSGGHRKMMKGQPHIFPKRRSHKPGFQTAGTRTTILVPEVDIARETALLEDTRPQSVEPEEKKLSHDFACASKSRPMSAFQTAGKGNTISVSERAVEQAAVLLRDPKFHADASLLSDVASSIVNKTLKDSFESESYTEARVPTIMFQTAGKGRAIAVSEDNVAMAHCILQDVPDSGTNLDNIKSPHNASFIMAGVQETASFLTGGIGTSQSVDEDSTAQAGYPPQEVTGTESEEHRRLSTVTNKAAAERATGSAERRQDSATKGSIVTGSRRLDEDNVPCDVLGAASNELISQKVVCFVERSVQDGIIGTAESCSDMMTVDDQGPTTQPLLPKTPLLFNRRDQSGHYRDDDCFRIRSVAFGLTPQLQSSEGDESRSVGLSHDSHLNHSSDKRTIYPAITPSNRTARVNTEESSESISKHPTFTPEQTPAETNNPVVTMSFDPKNPFTRKVHTSSSHSSNEKQTLSPVPINFLLSEENFQGEPLLPSFISNAENVMAGKPASSCDELQQTQMQPTRDPVTQETKTVTWSEDERNKELASARKSTLSEFASKYGSMEDRFDICLDSGIHPVTLAVDSNNATRVRFNPESGLPCSFFGQPGPTECKPIGSVKDLRESLVSRGCDVAKLSDKWISNHCRWIVWKLASTERRFAFSLAQSYFTYEHLVTQLHQRYDKELKGGNRSALRKVLNQDVAANIMMILCVSQIVRPNKSKEEPAKSSSQSEYILELTDGWYSIRGILDAPLCALVGLGRINVGSKLLICNAKFEGPEDGIDPLDSSYTSSGRKCSAALCLIANGTRLAKWDAKMGFVKPCRSMSSNRGSLLVRSISDIIPGGGNVPQIDLVVCRRYPVMFLERHGTNHPNEMLEKLAGKSPVISETMEYRNRVNFEKKRQRAIERLSESVQNECAKEVDEMAPKLWQSLMTKASPRDFYDQLSQSDQIMIDKWKDKRDHLLRDMVQKEIEAQLEGDTALFRESTPFVRVFMKSYNSTNGDAEEFTEGTCEGAMLTIWNPSELQLGLLWEGNVLRIRNVSMRSSKHEGLLQLTAGAKTQMEPVSFSSVPLASIGYAKRSFTNLLRVRLIAKKLSAGMLPNSPAPEVDTAGVLLRVLHKGSGCVEERETIYLTDETGMMLRLERDHFSEDDALASLSSSALQNVGNATTMAFRDLRVTHFDTAENCAVAVYAQTSSVATKAASGRISSLTTWANSPDGSVRLRRIAACVDVSIPMNQVSSTDTITAIGYIAGFDIPDTHGANHSHLEIKVDCGMGELRVWDLPFFLLDHALHICSVAPEPVSLDQAQDENYANLKVLGKIFSARGLLLAFSLRKKASNMADSRDEDERYEVRHVKVANSSALAELLVNSEKAFT